MAWSIEFDPAAFAELERLDPLIQRRIRRYLRERVSMAEDPESFARPLRGEKVGPRRYRVGGFRIVCAIEEKQDRVRVVRIGHRRESLTIADRYDVRDNGAADRFLRAHTDTAQHHCQGRKHGSERKTNGAHHADAAMTINRIGNPLLSYKRPKTSALKASTPNAYIGLDVHKEKVAVAVAYHGREKAEGRGFTVNMAGA